MVVPGLRTRSVDLSVLISYIRALEAADCQSTTMMLLSANVKGITCEVPLATAHCDMITEDPRNLHAYLIQGPL